MSSTVPSGLPVLARGRHLDPADGSCLMEYVSVLAGLRFSDQPRCTPPALNWLAQRVNDAVSDAARSELLLRAPVLARTCPVDPTALILRTVARAGHDLDPDDRWSRWAARLGARDAVSWRRPGLRSCLLEAFLAVEHRLAALPAPRVRPWSDRAARRGARHPAPPRGRLWGHAMSGPQLDIAGPAPVTAPAVHLVLGYRDDDAGRAALQVGADLAARLVATLHVVHVVDLSDYPIDPDAPDWERRADEHLAAEQRQVDSAMADSRCTWNYHAAHGDPVALLRRVADDHDALLFVVGTRGEGVGEVVSRLLGAPSVSHGLIARSHRPVVVCQASGTTHSEPAG